VINLTHDANIYIELNQRASAKLRDFAFHAGAESGRSFLRGTTMNFSNCST
jgi:hypothetical protein